MPNGHDKNWHRLCVAVEGFKKQFGHWPTKVRLYPECLADLREHLFTPADFAKIQAKVRLVEDEAGFIAEDDKGAVYGYGDDGSPGKRPKPSAAEWLGVEPKEGDSDVEVVVERPKK